ncbi:hypothetical protein GS982_31805, partial [Rhodococcus hoagii]|nr:hypothetical protein [Prescottella equi]
TVNVRKPAVFEAKDFDRARGIELQDAVESSIPVKLDKIADVSFAVTTEQLTQEITDFNTQLLAPAMMALAQKIDREILAMRDDITQQAGLSTLPGYTWDKPEVLIEAGRQLDINNVPGDQRVVVTGRPRVRSGSTATCSRTTTARAIPTPCAAVRSARACSASMRTRRRTSASRRSTRLLATRRPRSASPSTSRRWRSPRPRSRSRPVRSLLSSRTAVCRSASRTSTASTRSRRSSRWTRCTARRCSTRIVPS